MKDITIIMPFLNEDDEPRQTIESIYQTTNRNRFDLIVIDDCSDKPSDLRNRKDIRFIRNEKRIGVDACRQLGADLAETPNLFIIDAHMRFSRGWRPRVVDKINNNPNTLWCTTCMGLGYGNMDLSKSKDAYKGADFVMVDEKGIDILEPKWRSLVEDGDYDIPCVLGANYGVSKEWFDKIHGLKGLKMWGGSEFFMSLKTWMAGGSCKIMTDIKIGHKFRNRAPYTTNIWALTYNKLFMCKTILPEKLGDKLIDYIPNNVNKKRAIKEIKKDHKFIKSERRYYQGLFKRDIKSVCDQWGVAIPL